MPIRTWVEVPAPALVAAEAAVWLVAPEPDGVLAEAEAPLFELPATGTVLAAPRASVVEGSARAVLLAAAALKSGPPFETAFSWSPALVRLVRLSTPPVVEEAKPVLALAAVKSVAALGGDAL